MTGLDVLAADVRLQAAEAAAATRLGVAAVVLRVHVAELGREDLEPTASELGECTADACSPDHAQGGLVAGTAVEHLGEHQCLAIATQVDRAAEDLGDERENVSPLPVDDGACLHDVCPVVADVAGDGHRDREDLVPDGHLKDGLDQVVAVDEIGALLLLVGRFCVHLLGIEARVVERHRIPLGSERGHRELRAATVNANMARHGYLLRSSCQLSPLLEFFLQRY